MEKLVGLLGNEVEIMWMGGRGSNKRIRKTEGERQRSTDDMRWSSEKGNYNVEKSDKEGIRDCVLN